MTDHVFRIFLVPKKKTGHRIEPDLERDELAAIGYITAQWSFLEHAILAHTAELARKNRTTLPTDATNLSFTKRLRAWRLMIQQFVTDPHDKQRLLKLVSKIANLEFKRHKASHALWTWDPSDPATLKAFSFRPRVAFDVEFDFDGLVEVGHEIGEINFDLMFPGGKDHAWASFGELVAERGAFVSRSLLLPEAKKGRQGRRPLKASLPKRKRPQPPSAE